MHAALITREYPPAVYGGAGVHVEHLARALADHVNVQVHCFGEPRDDPLVAGAHGTWEALAGDAPHLAALRHLATDLSIVAGLEGADVAHSHTWYANLAGHLAALVYDIPHVVTTHSLEPLRPWKREQLGGGYALSSFAERTGIEGADAVIAVSAGMRDDVLRCYPDIDPEKLTVIHNGIDPDVYTPDRRTDALERFGIDTDRPSIVFVGRITRQKGVTHLLDAAADLDREAQLILCAGAPDTPELGREVSDAVAALREQRDGVFWIDEMLPRPDIVQLLSHATAFACPSIYEPFGLVNVEAMACEAAVVASSVGGIPEVVVEGETGHLVGFHPGDDPFGSPADPEAFAHRLADACNDLVRDPERARMMGQAGRARVLEHFSWPAIAGQTAGLYRSVIEGRSVAR
ncbi:glycogen synthase [Egibacter rhizosphaerae]|uniref:glycogen synthase n=1 Tax=Egibacter rhizosphaerae TaxID=1670831 RepID=UPI00197AD17E